MCAIAERLHTELASVCEQVSVQMAVKSELHDPQDTSFLLKAWQRLVCERADAIKAILWKLFSNALLSGQKGTQQVAF